jgi:hypothetical protein
MEKPEVETKQEEVPEKTEEPIDEQATANDGTAPAKKKRKRKRKRKKKKANAEETGENQEDTEKIKKVDNEKDVGEQKEGEGNDAEGQKKKKKRKRKKKKKKAEKVIFEITGDSRQTGYKPLLAYEPDEKDFNNFENAQDNSIIRNLGNCLSITCIF